MANVNTSIFTEKEIVTDFLATQKQTTSLYNTFAGECVNEQLRSTMLNILDEEHRIQADLFNVAHSHGWYPVDPAECTKVEKVKQRFSVS